MKKRITLLFVLCIFTLAACNEAPLLDGLNQNDANEVLVLLSKRGIPAQKKSVEKQQEITWSIFVAASDEDQARELLVANHLPKVREMGLSGVCKDASMIPTPKTEKCRELLALKGEIINSLETIPGVVHADVVLNIPDKEDFPTEGGAVQRPAASVVVQAGESPSESLTESKVQQFVANAVTGMDMRDVAVIISRVSNPFPQEAVTGGDKNPKPSGTPEASVSEIPPSGEFMSVAGLSMDAVSAKKFKIVAALFLGVFLLLSVALIVVLIKLGSSRQAAKTNLPAVVPGPSLPNKDEMDQLVADTGAVADEEEGA